MELGKRVLDQTWPTARRSPLNDQHVPVSLGRHQSSPLQLPRDWILDHGGQRVVRSGVSPPRSTRIVRNRKRGSKSPAPVIWIWRSTDTSSPLLPPRPREAKNYRTWPPPRPARLRPTSLGGSRKIEIPPLTKQTAHRSNPSNSPPTTLVTGSREGKISSSRAFGASTSQPASLSTGSSLKETRSIASPPMPAWRVGDQPNSEQAAAQQARDPDWAGRSRSLGLFAPGLGPPSRSFRFCQSLPILDQSLA